MRIFALLAVCLLSACSTSIDDYPSNGNDFDLREFFNGPQTAWGIIQDYSGKKTRHFCVDIVGGWQGNQGVLDEVFYFDDGERQTRVWKLQVADDGTVTGTAGDVIGTAQGSSKGNTFNWRYDLLVAIDGSEYQFHIDDWIFQLDENRLMNRSYMQKFGVTVAEISIYFDKTQPLRKCDKP